MGTTLAMVLKCRNQIHCSWFRQKNGFTSGSKEWTDSWAELKKINLNWASRNDYWHHTKELACQGGTASSLTFKEQQNQTTVVVVASGFRARPHLPCRGSCWIRKVTTRFQIQTHHVPPSCQQHDCPTTWFYPCVTPFCIKDSYKTIWLVELKSHSEILLQRKLRSIVL